MHLVGSNVKYGLDSSFAELEVVLAFIAVADFAQADDARHVLQLAVAVRRAGQAIERVIGDVQLHHAAAQLGELGALRAHLHARLDQRRARRRIALAPFDLDQAQPARAERLRACRWRRAWALAYPHRMAARMTEVPVGHRDRTPSISSVTCFDRYALRCAGVEFFD